MDIKQEFREEKNMDVYAMNVNDGSFSNVYVKWLEAKINYTRCCTEFYCYNKKIDSKKCKNQCMGCEYYEESKSK
jgi:hypothetical protein